MSATALLLGLCMVGMALAQMDHLNIHILAHTHDDVGWLKTVDQYYYGANNTIQDARVQYILDTVTRCLLENPMRKFTYVEIAYFYRWWLEQTDEMKAAFTGLVKSGQLEFVSAGWCMNDEASVHYEATIDQLTEGHQFLLNEFGVKPRIGWQIDPFGHASEYASLCAQAGFDGLFFARIDYQDYTNRTQMQNLEFIWRPTQSLGADTEIFTHVMYDTTYCYADNTGFEWSDVPPVQDDPRLFGMNVDEQAESFALDMRTRAKIYNTNNILVTFGCDFAYSDADINFKNMEKLMNFINNNETFGMTLNYSTPSLYLAAVHAANKTYTVKTDDFFPYADGPHSYWTGYMTSRQALKGYERWTSNLLHSVEKLYATAASQLNNNVINVTDALFNIDNFAMAHGVAQHHDGVSGTSKQHVAYDYAMRLNIGQDLAYDTINAVLGDLVTPLGQQVPTFSFCPLMNVSVCPALSALQAGQILPVVLYNHLPYDRTQIVRLSPVPSLQYKVQNAVGEVISVQLDQNADFASLYTLSFQATVPPLGYTTYFIAAAAGAPTPSSKSTPSGAFTIKNNMVTVNFDAKTKMITNIAANNLSLAVTQSLLWYNASAGYLNVLSQQASGAYIFRPNSSSLYPIFPSAVPQITVFQGDLITEVRQVWNAWLQQVVRIYANSSDVEVEISVQPMPINDSLGKELISQFVTPLSTHHSWYTDSMGQEFQTRVRDYRATWQLQCNEAVSCNYVPMNLASYIQDVSKNVQLSFATDRSRGCASMSDGELEYMVQRRLLYDDGRGVGEPLNETVPIRTTNRIQLNAIDSAIQPLRTSALELNNPFIAAFGPTLSSHSWPAQYTLTWSAVTNALPPNVNVIALRMLDEENTILLRLSHIFAVGEDDVLSQPVNVDVTQLFATWNIASLVETQLTGNQPISEISRLQWNTNAPGKHPLPLKEGVIDASDTVVSLQPLQIRTFVVTVTPKSKVRVVQ